MQTVSRFLFSILQARVKALEEGGGGNVAGADTQVQFNDGGSFGADAALAFTKATGALSSTIFNSTSSRRLKKSIKPFKRDALKIVNSIRIKEFNFKKDKEKTHRVGFIADDTDSILSGKNKDRFDINNTIGVLIKAVQELSKRIKKLEKE